MSEKLRIDKWMWAVRIFKTRSQAAEACKKGRIEVDGISVKASREIKVGDVIAVKRPPITYSYKVLALSSKRMAGKLAVDFVEEVTPQEQLDLLDATRTRGFEYRTKGLGRPTKHDRRLIEKLKGMK